MRYSFLILGLLLAFNLSADCIQGNCKNGKGIYEFTSGARYEGEFVNGELHGLGTFHYTNGNRYEGQWANNYREGEGKMYYASGEFYEGDYYRDRRQGFGEYTFKNGDKYIGEWHWDRPNGEGEIRFVNGAHYIGGFKNGKFHGQGTFRDAKGKIFSGVWTEGKLPGFNAPKEETPPKDVLAQKDQKLEPELLPDESNVKDSKEEVVTSNNTEEELGGEREKDENRSSGVMQKPVEPNWSMVRDCFMEKCMEGLGYISYASGSRYFGSFVNGVPEGEGTCFYVNGDVYTGGWKNHKPHGEGTMFYADGRVLSAEWKGGKTVRIIERELETVEQPQMKREPDPVTRIWAVLVGVARYDHLPSLRYSDDDAYRMFAFLKSPEGGALPDNQIKILIDEDATRGNILSAVQSTFEKADANDVVMLYMSGHGVEGEFAPIDFDGYRNLVSYDELKDIISKSEAQHKVVFADACYSGSLLSEKAGYDDQMSRYYEKLNETSNGVAFMLSCKDSETSLEDQGMRQGVYSHFLLRGLKGEADEDRDGLVGLKELFHFVYTNVRHYSANAQTPVLAGQFDPLMPVANVRY